MKKYILISIFGLLSVIASGNCLININSNSPNDAKIDLVSSDIKTSVLQFSIDNFEMKKVKTKKGYAYIINVNKATPVLLAGAPDLVKLTASIIIPDKSEMQVQIIYSEYKDYNNIEIAPSKGVLYRDIDPSSVPYKYGKVYTQNKFFPGKLTELRKPYIMRDYTGQTIIVYPFQYNPVTKILRVYKNIKVKIKPKTNSPILIKQLPYVDSEFKKIYARHFKNFTSTKYTPLEEQGNMLIISYGSFINSMQEFVNWKNDRGMHTEIVDVATIGTSADDIKTYVTNYYNTNGLTYLLLVGDAAQIPTNSISSGNSDNAYGYILGSDHYPEIFTGRFSAETVAHVQTQVERTINYELNPVTATECFNKGIGIASDLGPGDDDELDYEHVRNMQTDLLNYTYTYCDELFDGSQGGLDASGDPTPAMVTNDINNGTGIILYTGHGSETSWGTSGFSNNDVNNLTNTGMLPFIWSVACVNGDFVGNTCFAESWLRATNNNEPAGAVATLMSTINQSWDSPMCGQDEMVDILVESYTNNIKRTYSGISMNGCMKMIDEYGSDGESMADTWTIFGDPSLLIRTDNPNTMNVTHDNTIPVGSTQLQVNCDVEDALVSLTIDNQIIGTGTVTGSSATISFNSLSDIDTIKIVVTAYNYIPYVGNVLIISPSGPYIIYNNNQINDDTGNNNHLADYGENIKFDITLENVGVNTADSVYAVLSTGDTYITVNDNTQFWGDIAQATTSTQNNAYEITISDSVPDNHIVHFNLTIKDKNDSTWNSDFNINVNAPDISINNLIIDDIADGNGNGKLEPGETADIIILTKNNGHCDAENTIGNLSTTNFYVAINNYSYNLNTLSVSETDSAIFNITVSTSALMGSIADFNYSVTSALYNAQKTFIRPVGIIDEDFETDNFSKFSWDTTGSHPWIITDVNPYQGIYCAKSGNISDGQTSELLINFDAVADDSISFFRKVSSEQDYDFLEFYVDGNLISEWSGEQSWSRVSFPVPAGNHTFKWLYSKDNWSSSGSDCAWIDNIIFPPVYNTLGINNNKDNEETMLKCFPNPFVNSTNISYTLTKPSSVTIKIYNLLGEEKNILLNKTKKEQGTYTITFNASNLKAGVYYCVLTTDYNVITKKLMVIKH